MASHSNDITLTDEQRDNLAHFASLLFNDEKLAIIMDMPADEIRLAMKMKQGEIYRIVAAARLQSEAVIRDGIIKMAARGSTPAQHQALELLRSMKKDNV